MKDGPTVGPVRASHRDRQPVVVQIDEHVRLANIPPLSAVYEQALAVLLPADRDWARPSLAFASPDVDS